MSPCTHRCAPGREDAACPVHGTLAAALTAAIAVAEQGMVTGLVEAEVNLLRACITPVLEAARAEGARDAAERLGRLPELDNHHNAAACPYCTITVR